VLGPVLLFLYTADLISLIEDNSLSTHLYADDTQVYGFCRPAAVVSLSSNVSECVGVVSKWMRSNRFLLNSDKIEVLGCATVDATPTTHRHIVDRRRSCHSGVHRQEPRDFD
jgi:hypothetical protein